MSLQCEDAKGNIGGVDGGVGFPVRLLHPERKKEVSRLEFYAVGEARGETEGDQDARSVGDEDRLKEEAAALGVRLQAEEVSAQIETAQREARLEARADWEVELAERVEAERLRMVKACEQFGRERAQYFARVEAEVVKLALAIAARVLHREVLLDPLLLTATVRVALEKAAEDSTAILRVPAGDIAMWRGAFEKEAEAAVQLIGDERLGAGECVLETGVGKVELGVGAQLAEIEKGFFDLLQQRPA
ncbi:MAG: FliH/SctL family protein [Edaphobacter sp.]